MRALIIAPFWRTAGHVGIYRIDRFVRWLSLAGVKITLVRAGSSDHVTTADWGTEISVADPLKLHPDESPGSAPRRPARKPNQWRRLLAYAVFCPDLAVLWAKRAARHSIVVEHAKNASFVLSSSPPESAHIAASLLAKRFSIPLIIDMRDGWLDEPLKPLLRSSRIQGWREGRLEKAILKQAERIFVTSSVWEGMLLERLPFVRGKVTVLTNGYPTSASHTPIQAKRESEQPLTLVHTGRFTGSSLSRTPGLLLEPIYDAISNGFTKGEIVLIGALEASDLDAIESWKHRFRAKKWNLSVKAAIPRDEVLKILARADGLLLLSASRAAIPSKLFEYIAAQKPILAATPRESAVWQLSQKAPQLIPFDYQAPDAGAIVERFLRTARSGKMDPAVPNEFSEAHLSRVFLECMPSNLKFLLSSEYRIAQTPGIDRIPGRGPNPTITCP
jgi:glycosyltransferase involved in cell wall biosynthesis